ncbi:MAG: protein phosphatase 2C domain-containing protein [Bacteroidota bacterium]
MKIRIKQPIVLNEAGGRELNEDFVFPLADQANPEERLFIVSDGEGGANAGEVASKLLTLSMAKYFASTPPVGRIDQGYLDKALRTAEDSLTAYKDAHPESKHMEASMALAHLGDKQLTLAWIGTCRPYYYNGKDQKLLSPAAAFQNEDALITGSDQPRNLHMTVIAAEEIAAEDFIMLVTDGVLEHLQDRNIETMFQAPGIDPQKVTTELNNLSQSFTKDNYSAYIIQVDKVEGSPKATIPVIPTASKSKVATPVAAATPPPVTPEAKAKAEEEDAFIREAERSNQVARMITFGIIGVMVLGLVAWLVYSSMKTDYDKYLANGNAAVAAGSLDSARDAYSQARASTDDPDELLEVEGLIADVDRRVAEQALLASMPADSMDSFFLQANEMVDKGNYDQAITLYSKLVKAADLNGDSLVGQYKVKLGEAYYMLANKLYDEKDYEEVIRIYDLGKATFGNDLSPENDDLIAQAQRNYELALQETGSKPLVDEQLALNNKEASRRVASRNDGTSNTNPANRTTASTRSAGTMNPTEEARLRKLLASGKRSYTSAKTNNSVSLYRQAADDLESAAAVLDGSGAYLLAYMYSQGLGVQKDKSKALKYAQASARKGWPSGQFYYGHLLLEREYPRDTVTAIQSLRQAADQNFKLAVDKLIEMGVSVQ